MERKGGGKTVCQVSPFIRHRVYKGPHMAHFSHCAEREGLAALLATKETAFAIMKFYSSLYEFEFFFRQYEPATCKHSHTLLRTSRFYGRWLKLLWSQDFDVFFPSHCNVVEFNVTEAYRAPREMSTFFFFYIISWNHIHNKKKNKKTQRA